MPSVVVSVKVVDVVDPEGATVAGGVVVGGTVVGGDVGSMLVVTSEVAVLVVGRVGTVVTDGCAGAVVVVGRCAAVGMEEVVITADTSSDESICHRFCNSASCSGVLGFQSPRYGHCACATCHRVSVSTTSA